MLDHIFVLLDGSAGAEDALFHGAAIGHALHSQLTLLQSVDKLATGTHQRIIDPLDWHLHKSEAEAHLNRQANRLREAGLQIEQVLLETSAIDHVMDYASQHNVALIVVALQETGPTEIAFKLMKHTRIPVLLARAGGQVHDDFSSAAYRKILVPLDGSPRAECVLPLAGTLARASGAQLILAHVVRRPEISGRVPPSPEDLDLANRLVERNQAEGMKYLENIASQLGDDVQNRLLVDDNVATALHDLVEQEAADLVILSAHGYSAIPRWSHGSIANSFIAFGSKPVLVVQDLPCSTEPISEADAPVRQNWDR